MNLLNSLLQPWTLIVYAVLMFFVFLAMGSTSKKP